MTLIIARNSPLNVITQRRSTSLNVTALPPSPRAQVFQEEIFGPVTGVVTFKTEALREWRAAAARPAGRRGDRHRHHRPFGVESISRRRRTPSPTTPSTASARACGPATPTRCTRCEAHPPPSSHHQSAHPVHCAQVCSAPIAQGWRAGVSRRLSLRTLQVPRAIQAGRVWVNWCVDMSPQPPTPTPPTPPPPALASACLPPDSPAPVRKLPRLPGARPVWRLQEVGLRPRDAQDDGMLGHYRQTKNMLISLDKNKLGFF